MSLADDLGAWGDALGKVINGTYGAVVNAGKTGSTLPAQTGTDKVTPTPKTGGGNMLSSSSTYWTIAAIAAAVIVILLIARR